MRNGRVETAAHRGARLIIACVLVLTTARVAWAHIRLDSSNPGRDEIVTSVPAELRLEFSARIEERYTTLTVVGPDGGRVAVGAIAFVGGSDRVITAQLPPLSLPGRYTVRWRTAGADGHVLEGSYSFTLALDSATSIVEPTPLDTAAATANETDGHQHHPDPDTVAGPADAIGRGLHFLALLLLTGGIAFRLALVPRLDLSAAAADALRRRAWRVMTAAALMLGAAAVLRLWLQSTALHGAERAWNTMLLTIMLRDTSWGRAWVLQTFMFAVLGAAIAWARPRRDAIAARIALLAVLGLCTIPALSGHAAGATGSDWIIVANDTIHVFAAGAWIGTLALLMTALAAIARSDGNGRAVNAVEAFSPLALIAATAVVLTGLLNTVVHLSAVQQLWTTDYGRTLLVKLAFVALVMAAGFVNWRVVRPRLHAAGDVARLRLSASAELLFALFVLAATAVLTGQPRP